MYSINLSGGTYSRTRKGKVMNIHLQFIKEGFIEGTADEGKKEKEKGRGGIYAKKGERKQDFSFGNISAPKLISSNNRQE